MTQQTQVPSPTSQVGAGDVWKDGAPVGLWGPPERRRLFSRRPNTSPVVQAAPPKGDRWGLPDVATGFAFVMITQLLFSVVLIFIAAGSVGVDRGDDPADLVVPILDKTMDLAFTGPGVFFGAVSLWVSFLGAAWIASYKRGNRSFAKDFGLRFHWKRDIPLGLGLAVLLRAVEFGITSGLTALGVDLSEAGNTDMVTEQTGLWLILNTAVAASLGAPFFEELFFRGLFMGALLRNFGRDSSGASPRTWFGRAFSNRVRPAWATYATARRGLYRARVPLAVLFSSTVFGFMHFQGTNSFGSWLVIIQTGLIGVVLAIVAIRAKRLGPAITTHVFFNSSGVALALLFT